ncbi:MAG: glycoside hydrolase family 3 protein, partial [Bacteroidales bacterium]|nr:glycoside hydrolase family 3 protein [Bacteroidales bacterium]
DWQGVLSDEKRKLITDEHMRRFVFRNGVTLSPKQNKVPKEAKLIGEQITPYQAAEFVNNIQSIAEGSRLGIPVLFKTNARSHVEKDARYGINVSSLAFSPWPKEAGLAAINDISVLNDFAQAAKEELKSIGIRGLYGYMADLATEPRWNRIHETFTDNSQLCCQIISTLVQSFQGSNLNSDSVAMTVKHFFGGGPQEFGLDPHYPYGKRQVYPTSNLEYHLAPFKAAIENNVASIMPYYGIPVALDQIYLPSADVEYDKAVGIGMAFNKGIITDLLKGQLGFKGYVNSDTGIIKTRPWGLEKYSEQQLIAISLNAGIDVLSGYKERAKVQSVIGKDEILSPLNPYHTKGVSLQRVDDAVCLLLEELFELGLFENPYTDSSKADEVFTKNDNKTKAKAAQVKSIVRLKQNNLLPLSFDKTYFIEGLNSECLKGLKTTTELENAEIAIVRVNVSNRICPVTTENGERMKYLNGEEVDTKFGGALPAESSFLEFSQMENSKSWIVTPSVSRIKEIVKAVGSENVILAINFRQPYVLDEESGFNKVGVLLAFFGVSDDALIEGLKEPVRMQGRLPYTLVKDEETILNHPSDSNEYPKASILYPFGFSCKGLSENRELIQSLQ